jgi:hypothetical protein
VLSSNRNELLGRRTFQSATPENPYDFNRSQLNTNMMREQAGMLNEHQFLRRTEGKLDDFIGHGVAVLDNLIGQKEFLKVGLCSSK